MPTTIAGLALMTGYVVIAWWILVGLSWIIWRYVFTDDYECSRYQNEYGPDGLRRRK